MIFLNQFLTVIMGVGICAISFLQDSRFKPLIGQLDWVATIGLLVVGAIGSLTTLVILLSRNK